MDCQQIYMYYSNFLVNLSSSMDSAMTKKSPQVARGKTTMVGPSSPDPGKTGKKKPVKKNWTQTQSGWHSSWCGRG